MVFIKGNTKWTMTDSLNLRNDGDIVTDSRLIWSLSHG